MTQRDGLALRKLLCLSKENTAYTCMILVSLEKNVECKKKHNSL